MYVGSSGDLLRRSDVLQLPLAMSVLQMLVKNNSALPSATDPPVCDIAVRTSVASMDDYIAIIKKDIDAGRLNMKDKFVIKSDDVIGIARDMQEHQRDRLQPQLAKAQALVLALRQDVFVWAPHKTFPGLRVQCPVCSAVVTSQEWTKKRILHGLIEQRVYITVKYRCRVCPARRGLQVAGHRRTQQNSERKFQADNPEVLATFPVHVQAAWAFRDTGKIICDAGVVDFIRALATRTSWSAIAEAINELKQQAWRRTTHGKLQALCNALGLESDNDPICFPCEYILSADWVRNVYVADAHERQASVAAELRSETGDDVLVVDWTIDAAKRCGAKCLLNVMDGRRHILMSSLNDTCTPYGVKPSMVQLMQRGVMPKVVYVDSECCGAWADVVSNVWPNAVVKLDGMHALRRLTATTTSTQHPWHNRFCYALANALYTYDAATLARLQDARGKQGLTQHLPSHVKSKYVPRVIQGAQRIADAIDCVLTEFKKPHATAGPLLTSCNSMAWLQLREHVIKGCLCDPSGLNMNVFGDQVTIGGEKFKQIRCLRGSSALEGFHTHQKLWLGCLAVHAADAGAALLADGALRWNRKRQRDV